MMIKKAITLDQVNAALRFYEITFAPIRTLPVSTNAECSMEQRVSTLPPPSNPEPKDRP